MRVPFRSIHSPWQELFQNRAERQHTLSTDLKEWTGSSEVLAVNQSAAALYLAFKQLGFQPGQYVLLPTTSPFWVLSAVHWLDLQPVLFDVHPANGQLNLQLLEDFLSLQTMVDEAGDLIRKQDRQVVKGIIPFHAYGSCVELDHLLFIAFRYHLKVIENAGSLLGSTYKERPLGTLGDVGLLNSPGNTGCFLISQSDEPSGSLNALSEQEEQVIGFPLRMTPEQTVLEQDYLQYQKETLEKSRIHANIYREAFTTLTEIEFLDIPQGFVGNGREIVIKTFAARDLQAFLLQHQIETQQPPRPLHQWAASRNYKYINRQDQAGKLAEQLLALPVGPELNEQQQTYVIDTVHSYFHQFA